MMSLTMDQTHAIDKAFTYSRFAQGVARRDPELVARVRTTPDARLDLKHWRAALAACSVDTIDVELRRARRELMLRTVVRDLGLNAPFEEIVADLSSFADIALEAATAAHSKKLFASAEPPFGTQAAGWTQATLDPAA